MTICARKGCENVATYRYTTSTNCVRCADHKTDKMVTNKGNTCHCGKQATHRLPGSGFYYTHCFDHKTDNMTSVLFDKKAKKCIKCDKCATFGSVFNGNSAIYCRDHKTPDCISYGRVLCAVYRCPNSAIYKLPKTARPCACENHKVDGMIKFETCHCGKLGSHYSGDVFTCFTHKSNNSKKIFFDTYEHKDIDVVKILTEGVIPDCLIKPNEKAICLDPDVPMPADDPMDQVKLMLAYTILKTVDQFNKQFNMPLTGISYASEKQSS